MSNPVAPSDRPTKICPICGRPFTWRKKWAKVWDEVRYCSERCRRHRQDGAGLSSPADDGGRRTPSQDLDIDGT